MIRLALTGATGFIGRRLLAHLAAEPALRDSVYLHVHARRSIALPAGLRGEIQLGPLDELATWQRLLDSTDGVLHLAGAVRGIDANAFAINHTAVRALLTARAATSPSAAVLLVSSLAARRPELSYYAASKAAAETALSGATGITAIVRPPAVYGPGDVEMLPLLRAMAAGIGLYPGQLDARVSLLHVDDLCRAMIAWLRAPQAGLWEPDDGRPDGYSWRDLHHAIAQVTGRRVQPIRLPPRLLRTVARALVAIARLGGPVPMLSPAKVRELIAEEWVCRPMTTPLADWRPRITLQVGLTELLRPNGAATSAPLLGNVSTPQ